MDNDLIEFKYEEVNALTYTPKTETELINYSKTLISDMRKNQMFIYWLIGSKINSFYKMEYGKNKLNVIAEGIGVKLDTLHKATKFARVYTEDKLRLLLNGEFILSWFHVSANLSVDPDSMIEIYGKTSSPANFGDEIYNYKKHDPNKKPIKKRLVKTKLQIITALKRLVRRKDKEIELLKNKLIIYQSDLSEVLKVKITLESDVIMLKNKIYQTQNGK